jgi:hypothetical protein
VSGLLRRPVVQLQRLMVRLLVNHPCRTPDCSGRTDKHHLMCKRHRAAAGEPTHQGRRWLRDWTTWDERGRS